MNQMSKTALISDDADVFMQEAAERLAALGYDIGTPVLRCDAYGMLPRWKFRPSIYMYSGLPECEGATLHECITKARAWLDDLKPDAERLEAILGFKP